METSEQAAPVGICQNCEGIDAPLSRFRLPALRELVRQHRFVCLRIPRILHDGNKWVVLLPPRPPARLSRRIEYSEYRLAYTRVAVWWMMRAKVPPS